ncbi:MAG: AarF/UbiB family protein, partial [Kiloniellales bacterium]|nr:AarF/UbiB family protein [Kiloniellales bacterium]
MLRTLRTLLRLITIARTLARHDALAPLQQLGVAPAVGRFAALVSRRHVQGRPGQKLAAALTELGPSFIKLGQFLSTRADLLGEQMAADLSELQDALPPFPAEQARQILEQELDQPLEALFESFDDTPVSAASIAQVHLAVTRAKDDRPVREVAVKVLRPGVEAAFALDLALFYDLAALAERTQPRLRR